MLTFIKFVQWVLLLLISNFLINNCHDINNNRERSASISFSYVSEIQMSSSNNRLLYKKGTELKQSCQRRNADAGTYFSLDFLEVL